MKFLAPACCLLLLGACASPRSIQPGRVVDLTYPFDSETVYWPTEPDFQHELYTEGLTPRGYWYAAGRFAGAEHGGTHIDAPFHFSRHASTVDAIEPDRLIGPGVLIDVTAACRDNRDYLVSILDIQEWEDRHGQIPNGAIVLLRTGFGEFYPDRERYMGTAERGPEAVAKLHFPGLDPEAARWMATRRSIGAIGLDTPSIDRGQSVTFLSHLTLFEHDIPALENVAHLDQLPESGFQVIALPMMIRGGTGGPLRIVALLP